MCGHVVCTVTAAPALCGMHSAGTHHLIPESSRRYRRGTGEGGCWGPSARYRGQPDCRLGQQWCTARVASSRGHDPERMVPSTRPGRMFGGEVRYKLWAHGCCSRSALQGVTRAVFPTTPHFPHAVHHPRQAACGRMLRHVPLDAISAAKKRRLRRPLSSHPNFSLTNTGRSRKGEGCPS